MACGGVQEDFAAAFNGGGGNSLGDGHELLHAPQNDPTLAGDDDVNTNGTPDAGEDANTNNTPDLFEMDVNTDGTPDLRQINGGSLVGVVYGGPHLTTGHTFELLADANSNGTPDVEESLDANTNGTPDAAEFPDANSDGTLDWPDADTDGTADFGCVIGEGITSQGSGAGDGTTTERQYIWGPDYVDECVAQITNAARPGGAKVLYVLQDANYNVIGLVTAAATPLCQYTWSPYGELLAFDHLAAMPDNTLGHQGLFVDRLDGTILTLSLLPNTTEIYHVRNRTYIPAIGRWGQRDIRGTSGVTLECLSTLGHVIQARLAPCDIRELFDNNVNVYQYCGSMPTRQLDPTGLFFGLADITVSAGFQMDSNGQTIDMGVSLLGAIQGFLGANNFQQMQLAYMLGQASSLTGGEFEYAINAYHEFQTYKTAVLAAGIIYGGVKFAADGLGRYASAAGRAAGNWFSWRLLPKIVRNGREYAIIENYLYTEHAINMMMPAGLGKAAGELEKGRGIPVIVVENVLAFGNKIIQSTGRVKHTLDNISVITEAPEVGHDIVVTVMKERSR